MCTHPQCHAERTKTQRQILVLYKHENLLRMPPVAWNSSCDFIHLAEALVGGHLWKFRSTAWTGRMTLAHAVTHSLTHSRCCSLTHSLTHSFIHSFMARTVAAAATARSTLIRFLKSCTTAFYPFSVWQLRFAFHNIHATHTRPYLPFVFTPFRCCNILRADFHAACNRPSCHNSLASFTLRFMPRHALLLVCCSPLTWLTHWDELLCSALKNWNEFEFLHF